MITYNYSVLPEDMDVQKRIKVPAMCRCVVNAIGQYIKKEGFGIDVMLGEGFSWVLSRYAFEFDTLPSLYEPFEISVWDGEPANITVTRCVKISNAEGKEIGRGVTDWCIIDRKTRCLIRPSAFLTRLWNGESSPCRKPERIAAVTIDESETRLIHSSDCDFNGHVNNIKYVEMMYDMLPDSTSGKFSPFRLSAFFHKEALIGQTLTLGIGKTEGGYNCVVADSSAAVCTLALRSR